MIAKCLITVGDVFKTGSFKDRDKIKPIYHKVTAVYWDNISKEVLYELHYIEMYTIKKDQLEYIKWTILANNQELMKFINLGNIRV